MFFCCNCQEIVPSFQKEWQLLFGPFLFLEHSNAPSWSVTHHVSPPCQIIHISTQSTWPLKRRSGGSTTTFWEGENFSKFRTTSTLKGQNCSERRQRNKLGENNFNLGSWLEEVCCHLPPSLPPPLHVDRNTKLCPFLPLFKLRRRMKMIAGVATNDC